MALVLNDSQKCGTEVLLQPPGTKCMPVYARMRMEMHGEQHTFLTSGNLDPRAAEAREEYKGQWAFETLKSLDDKNTHTLFFLQPVMFQPGLRMMLVLSSDGLQTFEALKFGM